MENVVPIILASGRGSRMGGITPKPLLEICNKPILRWTTDALSKAGCNEIYIVLAHMSDVFLDYIDHQPAKPKLIGIVESSSPEGNGKTVRFALENIPLSDKPIVIVYADDSVLFTKEVYEKLISTHHNQKSILTLLTLEGPIVNNLGGIDISNDGKVMGLMTHSELTSRGAERTSKLCGLLCFNQEWLRRSITTIKKDPVKNEYLLVDLINLAVTEDQRIIAVELGDDLLWNSLNTPEELVETERKMLIREATWQAK